MTLRHIAGTPYAAASYDADIIILALDRVEETIAAINSARSQTGVDAAVWILDQGSKPENLARIQEAVAGRCCLYAADRNLGVAEGRNVASGLGHGRIVVALDNDAIFAMPETVARMVAAIDAEPTLAAIGCRIITDSTGCDDLSSWGYPHDLLPAAGENWDAVTFVGAGHAIRRTAWQEAGGYDPALFFCWEEFDFSLRAIALGWRVRYRGDIVIRHKVAAERRVAWSDKRWFYFVRNRLYIQRKLGRSIIPRTCGYMLKGTLNGMPLTTLTALAAAWRMPPALPVPQISPRAQDYLRRNDRAHRGSWVRRIVREVFTTIGPVRVLAGR